MEPQDPNNPDIHPDPIVTATWRQLFQVEGDEKNTTSPGVVNLAVGNDGTLYANSPNTPPAPVVIPRISVEGAEWVFSGTFSSSDADTVAWGAGTLTTEDGHTYAIGASNTGNMAAKTYIYFDVDVSTTAFQTTTTAGNSVGAGKILIAIAQNATGEAKFMALNDNQYNIDAANIVANSITANELSTSITYAGSIVIDSAGLIRSGQTAYNTGTGWWIGNDSGTPKLSIGTPTADYFIFDGTNVEGTGSISAQIPLTTYQEFAGASTPVPVFVNTLGTAQVADANLTGAAKFIGFVGTTTTALSPVIVASSPGTAGGSNTTISVSPTLKAGTNRVWVFQLGLQMGGSLVTMPSGITFNGNAMTILQSDINETQGQVIAYYIAGSSGSDSSPTIAVNGVTAITHYEEWDASWATFEYCNQSDPIGASGGAQADLTAAGVSITPERAPSMILNFVAYDGSGSAPTWADGQTEYAFRAIGNDGNIDIAASYVLWKQTGSNSFNATVSSGPHLFYALELLGSSASVKAKVSGTQAGFTGLTIGSTYYVSDTEGVISTTPGTTTILVGKAISTTSLLIVQSAT